MSLSYNKNILFPLVLLALLFVAAALFRPLLPIDETRYMSVAWEMFLRKNYILLSVNFEHYHQKPPLLFWLINISWEIFGISRWAALAPAFIAAALLLILSRQLAFRLFPDKNIHEKMPWVLLGSVPFLMYSTLIMFDVLLAAFVLATFLILLSYANRPSLVKIMGAGFFLGLAVLTKGPVGWLHVILPGLFFPLWRNKTDAVSLKVWYGGLTLAFVISVIPIGFWVSRVALQTDSHFMHWLLWTQTAGRINGSFSSAHSRPVYFYLMLLPLMFLPWALMPRFWTGATQIRDKIALKNPPMRFLLFWFVPVFLSFSLIAGKQPHYLVPLLPCVVMMIALLLETANFKAIRLVSFSMVVLLCLAQIIGSRSFFRKYDLQPVASYVAAHKDKEWAFVRSYEGEIGFLGRIDKKIFDLDDKKQLADWFNAHPHGMAVIRFSADDDLSMYKEIFSQNYRGKFIGIYEVKKSN